MVSLANMPSTSSVLATYTSFAASAMLVRTVINEIQTLTTKLIPRKLREKLLSRFEGFCGKFSDHMLITIDESNGFSVNEIYHAAELYSSTIIGASVQQLKVYQGPRENGFSITISKGQKIIDAFQGMQLTWEFTSTKKQKTSSDGIRGSHSTEESERKSIHLSFHKKYKDKVLSAYLPFVVEKAKVLRETKRIVKLHSLGPIGKGYGGTWGSIDFKHPSTFDKLAMDPVLKKELMDDLERFLNRREFYQRVGKAWKRGYLLYGPPGTGKSSLIAAIANHLKFDIYDMELTSIKSNSGLRRLLAATRNRSILVIEDIDCSTDLENRESGEKSEKENQMTLSGLLNFVDGLWSSCGDERIIIFTTNYKERIDPALLRPGRMDMHIHMSYLTPSGFKILALNYLEITSHSLFGEIEQLLTEMEVTAAEVAEELLKSDKVDKVLERLVEFLEKKKEQGMKRKELKVEEEEQREEDEQENKRRKIEEENGKKNTANKNRRKPTKKGKGRRRNIKA